MSPTGRHKIRKTVGIDLGTTNSVIAVLDATDSAIITGEDEHGCRIIPSVVGYVTDEARPAVGRPVAAFKGQQAVSSVKRYMGLQRQFAVGPDLLTPPAVSSRILTHLRHVLARTLNDSRYLLDAAIITMPAYFNHNQIEATRQAGELAGFEVVELLHEPTAAAIYYSWIEGHGDATYLVYDLGGGTFDVSVIRKRLGDYEVISVSGDPFLGGDDFDRLLASYLLQGEPAKFDPNTPEGAANFARFLPVAEGIKIELSERDVVRRELADFDGPASVEVQRSTFNRLIKDKVDRTIACCHEALKRAHDKAGLRLGDIDYVVLVGGSSRIPLVRDTVRSAFCKADLPEHVRHPEPLLHEPDLCVAYGAALRAATYGTSYPDLPGGLELHLTSPLSWSGVRGQESGDRSQESAKGPSSLTPDSCPLTPELTPGNVSLSYTLTGVVRGPGAIDLYDGGSVRIRALATGLVEEAFLDVKGTFAQELELIPETDNAFQLTLCDASGEELVQVPACVRHRSAGRQLGLGVLPTQLITKPLQIEVLNRQRQRVKQVIAPVGATLPGTFACSCRTLDQTGRILVPIFEENRVIKEMVIDDVDPMLPLGSPVDVELNIDVKHNIQVRVVVRQAGRAETATIQAPPPPQRPERQEIEAVRKRIEELLPEFSGAYRTRVKAQVARLLQDLNEALRYDDEPKSIQRMAELRDLLDQLQLNRGQVLEPPWPRFAQLVKHCLIQSASVADRTGRSREELFEQVYAQERYAEQAYEEKNQTLYRECFENLSRLASYLDQLLHEDPGGTRRTRRPAAEQQAPEDVEQFKGYLAHVLSRVHTKGRRDLEDYLNELARQGEGLDARAKTDPAGCIREVRRLATEIAKVEQELSGQRSSSSRGDEGLLGG
jgi:molecular chaperone DnaK